MSEKQDRGGARSEERGEESREYRKNAEAKFASPDGSSEGIGYYDEEGNQLTPDEFSALVARDAARIRDADGGDE